MGKSLLRFRTPASRFLIYWEGLSYQPEITPVACLRYAVMQWFITATINNRGRRGSEGSGLPDMNTYWNHDPSFNFITEIDAQGEKD